MSDNRLLIFGLLLVVLVNNLSVGQNEPRIFNGTKASKEKWPFAVALFELKKSGKYEHFCGGSVINEDTILTAAHCFFGVVAHKVMAYVGNSDIANLDKQFIFHAKELIWHEQYSPHNDNDLGIVKLKKLIDFDKLSQVKPVCIAELDNIDPTKCVIMGWGFNEKMAQTTELFQLEVPILDDQTCARYERLYRKELMICAGYLEGGKDACTFDSGGPLVCPFSDEQSRYAQRGIVSFGSVCAKPNSPGYYTKVNRYVEWIEKHAAA